MSLSPEASLEKPKGVWAGASLRAKAAIIFANLLSLACLGWALHDAELQQLGQEILDLKWGWIAIAVIADIFVYVCQGYRWSLVLQPLAGARIGQCIRAIYVGLFANEVLPFRSGEVIRCYLQARSTRLPFPVVLSSAVVERIFDGIWLITFFVVTTRFQQLPGVVDEFAFVLMLIVLGLASALAAIVFSRKQTEAWLSKPPISWWKARLLELIEDLHAMGKSPTFYWGFLASLPYLALQVIPIYAVLRAYGFEDGNILGPAAVVMLVLRLGTVVPSAPGNLGTFQVLAAQGLALFVADAAMAKRFSFLLWGVITLPLLMGGFVAVAMTGLKIRQIQREAHAATSGSTLGTPDMAAERQ